MYTGNNPVIFGWYCGWKEEFYFVSFFFILNHYSHLYWIITANAKEPTYCAHIDLKEQMVVYRSWKHIRLLTTSNNSGFRASRLHKVIDKLKALRGKLLVNDGTHGLRLICYFELFSERVRCLKFPRDRPTCGKWSTRPRITRSCCFKGCQS